MLDKLLKKKLKNDESGLPEEESKALASMTTPDLEIWSGVGPHCKEEVTPDVDFGSCEDVLFQHKSTYFRVGRARQSSHVTSGYGGEGDPFSHEIRLVVGGGGIRVKEEDKKTKQRMCLGPKPAGSAGEDYDMATLLVTSKHPRDAEDFGLRPSNLPRLPCSMVAAKADQIVLNASAGDVTIVTGTDSHNSQRGPNVSVGNIYLNPGNNPIERLQPAVLGDNLYDTIEEIYGAIDDLVAQVNALTAYQGKLNKAITTHYHHSPFFALPTSPSFQCAQAGAQNAIDTATRLVPALMISRIKNEMNKNKSGIAGSGNFKSRNVKLA